MMIILLFVGILIVGAVCWIGAINKTADIVNLAAQNKAQKAAKAQAVRTPTTSPERIKEIYAQYGVKR